MRLRQNPPVAGRYGVDQRLLTRPFPTGARAESRALAYAHEFDTPR
jgi:hypothetical protein